MNKIYQLILVLLLFITSCADLDIPPKNIISDEDLLTSESGMNIYLARMYSNMPFEDFKYMAEWGVEFNSWLGALGIEGTGEALNRDGISTAFRGERTPYWGKAFTLLRDANYLIENLPLYEGSFPENMYNHYLGEAYFVRAFVFNAMARRFGGVPLPVQVRRRPGTRCLPISTGRLNCYSRQVPKKVTPTNMLHWLLNRKQCYMPEVWLNTMKRYPAVLPASVKRPECV